MSLLAATGLATLLASATLALPPQDALEISSSDTKSLIKAVQSYNEHLDENQDGRALKDLEDIQDKLESIAKKEKLDDPTKVLGAITAWREIMRESSLSSSPERISATGRFGNKPWEGKEEDCPLPYDSKNKDLSKAFDGTLKAFVSVPRDAKNELMPVILALHPQDGESGAVKDLKQSRDLVKEVAEWVETAYPEELREKAIIVAPVMDYVELDSSGLTGSRPDWNDRNSLGPTWALSALSSIVLRNVNHDPTRIFVDGHGSASVAALIYASRYQGLISGAIVRGTTPDEIQFQNCRNSPILFVGADAKSFYDRWSKEQDFRLTHMDEVDEASLGEWLSTNQKVLAPTKVEAFAENMAYANAYWISVVDINSTLETRDPIHIAGEIDRENNSITVTTSPQVRSFFIYLNDAMLDLDKKITIIHRGPPAEEGGSPVEEVRFEGTKRRILDDMLEVSYWIPTGNLGEVYMNSIQIDL